MAALSGKADFNPKDFGLHRSWSGGGTTAANTGVRDFNIHRKWKSNKAQNSYVKDDLHQLSSVSLSLRL